MDIEIINILKKHGCLYMADDYKELLTDIQEHYKKSQALQLLQPDVSNQREQLIAFADAININDGDKVKIEKLVDLYLKSN